MSLQAAAISSQKPGGGALAAIVLVSLLLNAVPFWWGLPARGELSWAFDEIAPSSKGEISADRHRGRYPPFHYQLLRAVYSPFRWLASTELVDWDVRELPTVLRSVGRLLSSLMGVGIVLVVHRLAWLAFRSQAAARLAALLLALSPVLVYYSKMVNLEVPYLFWAALSMLFFWHAIFRHRLRDYVLFGLTAALSICTKDQAAGLYPLPALALWIDLARHRSGRISAAALARALIDKKLLAGFGAGVVAFVLIHGLLVDPTQFRHHLRVIFGPASQPYQRWDRGLSGQVAMGALTVRHLVFLLGVPAVLAAVYGLIVAAKKNRVSLVLLVFPLSYYLFFIIPVMYHYDRFLLPLAVSLAIFGGFGLAALARRIGSRPVAVALVGIVALYGLGRAISIDLLMWNDARYAAEEWVRSARQEDEKVVVLGKARQDSVRIRPFIDWDRLRNPGLSRLRSADADYIVFNRDEAHEQGFGRYVGLLENGRLNYRTARVFEWSPPVDLLRASGVLTNLSRVSPETVVVRRVDEWGLSGSEAMLAMRALWLGERDDWDELTEAIWSGWFMKGRRSAGEDAVAIGRAMDDWTRPGRPAFVIVRNATTDAVAPVLRLSTAKSAVPSSVVVAVRHRDGEIPLEIVAGGYADVRLPEIDSGELLGLLVIADAASDPENQPRRRRAVRLRRVR